LEETFTIQIMITII